MKGGTTVNRKPPHNLEDITQSVVFDKSHKWTIPKAKAWLKHHGYHYDSIDNKPTQLRFRQYNPEDLFNRHFISKKIKKDGVLLIISVPNGAGTGFMVNNVEILTPEEIQNKAIKNYAQQLHQHNLAIEHLVKEKKSNLKKTKKASTIRISKSLKGSQAMKEKMAKLRALKKV